MNNGLKIYACSGISGDARTGKEKLNYQLEGTSTTKNTRAMNILLSLMNEQLSKLRYSGSMVGSKGLNMLDLYSTAFYFARLYREQPKLLQEAGYCIQQLQDAGKFASESTDMQEHESLVSGYIEAVGDMIESGDVKETTGSIVTWWAEYIMGMNEVGLQDAAVSGVDRYGIDEDSDLSKYLNDGAEYFLYYDLLSEQEAKSLSPTIYRKWKKQREVYDYCVLSFVGIYGTEETMVRIIESGIRSTFGRSLGEIKTSLLQSGGTVGAISASVASIIVALIGAVVSIIVGILSYAAQVNAAKYTAPANVDEGIAEAVDWEGTGTGNGTFLRQAGSKYLAIGLGALALGTWWHNRK